MNTFLADSIQFKSNPAQVLSKSEHDAKGIAPYFETYFKEISKLHHHLKCFNKSELDSNSNGFTNIKVILNKFNKSELVSNELENIEDILIKITK